MVGQLDQFCPAMIRIGQVPDQALPDESIRCPLNILPAHGHFPRYRGDGHRSEGYGAQNHDPGSGGAEPGSRAVGEGHQLYVGLLDFGKQAIQRQRFRRGSGLVDEAHGHHSGLSWQR